MKNTQLNEQAPAIQDEVANAVQTERPKGISIPDPRVEKILEAKKLAAYYGNRYKLRKRCEAQLRRKIKAGELLGFDVE